MNEIESLQKELGAVETTAEAVVAGEAAGPRVPEATVVESAEAITEPAVSEPEYSEPAVTEPEPVVAEAVSESVITEEPKVVEVDDMAEFRGTGGDAGLEETLSDLEQIPAQGPSILDGVVNEETAAVPAPEQPAMAEADHKGAIMAVQETDVNSESGSVEAGLSMTLTGKMTLKLAYEYEGEQVSISFVDQALMVQLSDGTEFKIPVRRRPALRRVA
ncbi:MAG: hypothetical protein A2070_08720 [Bdellovibrionales bacterium GWC1_52_8]|nr:MAG: hypothetical protein A2070_08720 [Bdellovibrionales bacterium GWC1_52_8]